MKLADIFAGLRNAKSELASKRATEKKLQRELEDERSMPLPKSELADLMDTMIDECASAYPERLARSIAEHAQNPMQKRAPLNHDEGSGNGIRVCTATEFPQIMATPKTIERALCFLLRDQLKAGVRKAIDEMPYTALFGRPMSERMKRIAKLESELANLRAEIKEIEEEMRQGGIA